MDLARLFYCYVRYKGSTARVGAIEVFQSLYVYKHARAGNIRNQPSPWRGRGAATTVAVAGYSLQNLVN